MSATETIFSQIESNRKQMVDLQTLLCSIPAIAPESGGEGELKKAEALAGWLKRNSMNEIRMIYAPDKRVPGGRRPNIIVTIPGKKKDANFWIMTHLDVVPPGDMTLWKTPPYETREEDGKLTGRGVEDNQQSMVASIFAALSLQQLAVKPLYTVKLLFVADEEVGSEKGIKYLLKHHSLFRKQDLILAPDIGNKTGSIIEIAEKSILWLRFKTEGAQCHASAPQKGRNAFVAGSALVLKLNGLNGLFTGKDDLFNPPVSTFSPTKKENNIPNINTIPAEDVFYLDCRILPSTGIEAVIEKINELIKEVEDEYNVRITYTVEQRGESESTPEDAPIVTSLMRAIPKVYDTEPKVVGIGGGTVAAPLRNAGYATAAWSRVAQTAHMPNEYCLIDNLVGDAKVMAYIMLEG
jgi:succinyl-diaminopimelate desuccinylase